MFRRRLICSLLCFLCTVLACADTIIVAGRSQTLTTPLVVDCNEVLAPMATALVMLDASTTLNNGAILIKSHDGRSLHMCMNSPIADSDGRQLPLNVAPRCLNGQLYLPVRALACWLNAESAFDAASRTLTISPLLQVSSETRDDTVAVLVRSAAPLQYTSGHLCAPARTYYDFKYVALGTAATQLPIHGSLVEQVRVAQYSTTPNVVRLVVDLNGDGDFTTTLGEGGRLLTIAVCRKAPAPITPPSAPVAPSAPDAPPAVTLPLANTPPSATLPLVDTPPPTPITPTPPPAGPYKLLDLALTAPSDKQSTLHISTDGPVAVEANYDAKHRQLALNFANGCNNLPPEHLLVSGDKIISKIDADGMETIPGTCLKITCNKDIGYLITHGPSGITVTMGVFSIADMTVVLDPGHGGHDTGAISCHGNCEKDVTLAVMQRVAKLLLGAGAKVLLTRADDTFIPLTDRSGLANVQHADVFVSVHCNSSPMHNSSSGTEIYYTTPQSYALASAMHGELIPALELKDGGIRARSLSVTRKSLMPAILIELAYINNDREEKLLLTDAFQQKAAEAIVSGLCNYAASNVWKLRRGEIAM